MSGFATQTAVWQEIEEELRPGFNAEHGYTLPEREESAAMRWGNCFESAIIELAERAAEQQIRYREKSFLHGFDIDGYYGSLHESNIEKAPVTCHVDGIYEPGNGKYNVLHEGKTASSFIFREKWGTPGTDRVPGEYQIQTQHQMICTGAEKVIVSVLCWPETPEVWEREGWEIKKSVTGDYSLCRMENERPIQVMPFCWADTLYDMGFFYQYTVEARPSLQAVMLGRYKKFWEEHVIPGIPPEPENYDDIKRLFPEPKTTLVVTEDIERLLSEYSQINAELKDQEKRQGAIKTKVLDWARGRTDGAIDEDSTEALILRNGSGDKVGSYTKNKNGALVFRA
jgi:hypothetical protein